MLFQNNSVSQVSNRTVSTAFYKAVILAFGAVLALFAFAGCSCSSSTNNDGASSQQNSSSTSSDSNNSSSQNSQDQSGSSSSSSSQSSDSSSTNSSSASSAESSSDATQGVATGVSSDYTKVTASEKPSTVSDSVWQTLSEYEQTMCDYYEFLKKYNANPNDEQLITEAQNWSSTVNDVRSKFSSINRDSLSQDEKSYYDEVQTRVNLMIEKLGK